jgi:hypothetical protein
MDAERQRALAAMARAGLSLAEMAARLGVTRQRIHQQLSRYPEIAAERAARRQVRQHVEGARRQRERGIQWAELHAHGGAALADFLREAIAHGWTVDAAPQRRPRINGVRLALHMPLRTRPGHPAHRGSEGTRYYHVQLMRADWLHVVYLPTGRYVFYFPDPARRSKSVYIPEVRAYQPQEWPAWPAITVQRRKTWSSETVRLKAPKQVPAAPALAPPCVVDAA